MMLYLDMQIYASMLASMGRMGPVTVDTDRDYVYWQVIQRREADLPSDKEALTKEGFTRLSKDLAEVFIREGHRILMRGGPGDYTRGMGLYAESATMGSTDGMLRYLTGCGAIHTLTRNQRGSLPDVLCQGELLMADDVSY
jgi:predicted thioredoxin/glutaredoxin